MEATFSDSLKQYKEERQTIQRYHCLKFTAIQPENTIRYTRLQKNTFLLKFS